MVVFRVISNLLRMALGLIFLPLRLLGIPLAILMVPVRIIMHNFVLIAVVIIAILVYRSCTDPYVGGSKPGMISTPKQAKNRGNGPIVIDPVTKQEDGDSAFATDVYATMSDEERAYYSHMFYTTMSTLPDGQTHEWTDYNIAGSLRPEDTFSNNVGVRCRHFSEALKVHEVQQTLTGIACDNGGGKWCKLKSTSTPGCNLGQPARGFLDSIGDSVKDLF